LKLSELDLLKLQTSFMKNDATTKALCASLNPQLIQIADKVKKCLILSNVDMLPEPILDELAWELHIDWYDATASIEVKRNLIRNSDKVHMYMGTVYAIEQVIEDYFGDGYVEEWFQYNGQPYHFKVITTNPSITGDLANQFQAAINAVKRKSTVLEEIIVLLSGDLIINMIGIVQTGDNLTFLQEG
jgi:phage tail P2-like protein